MTPEQINDLITENQAMLEGVKDDQSEQFLIYVIALLAAALSDNIATLRGTQISSLSPATLNRLIRRIEADQFAVGSAANNRLLVELKRLAAIESGLGSSITETRKRSTDALFGEILNQPVGEGATLEMLLAAWIASHNTNISNLLRRARAQGIPNDEVLRLAIGSRRRNNRDSIIGSTTTNAIVSTVNTAIQHVAVSAIALSGLQWYRWVSVLDSKTSARCRSLSGKIFEVNKGPLPPAHINCRSTIAPASGPSEVAPEPSYYEWLSRQSAATQDRVLGKKRGLLFRKGGLSTSTFAELQLDRNFNPLTLDELAEEVPAAFERANLKP